MQAVASADWATAHGVLVQQLAPQWWCTGQMGKLQAHLKKLQASSGLVQAAVGSAAWKSGAGLYSAFLSLEASLASLKQSELSFVCLCCV